MSEATIRFSKFEKIILRAMVTQVTPIIIGQPGVGKTTAMYHLASKLGRSVTSLLGAIIDPTVDISGLPVIVTEMLEIDGKKFPVTCYAPRKNIAKVAEDGGFIVLDDFLTCSLQVQAALLQAVLEKRFGDLQLNREKTCIVALANPIESTPNGQELAPAMGNRFAMYDFPLDVEEWTNNYPSFWGNPPKLGFSKPFDLDEKFYSRARSIGAGFIKKSPDKLHMFPKEASLQSKPYPSPRSIDHAVRHVAAVLADGLPIVEATPHMAACIGDGVAGEFVRWAKQADLPDPEDMLADPVGFPLPKAGDVLFSALTSVAGAVVIKTDAKRWLAAWKIFQRAAEGKAADIGAAAALQLACLWKDHPQLPRPTKEILPYAAILEDACLLPTLQPKKVKATTP